MLNISPKKLSALTVNLFNNWPILRSLGHSFTLESERLLGKTQELIF